MTDDNRNYVVRFGDGSYYSKNKRWSGVKIGKATWLTHKLARFISSKLNQPRIDMKAVIEPRN